MLPNLDALKELNRQLTELLEQPEPELVMWQMCFYRVMQEIAKLVPPRAEVVGAVVGSLRGAIVQTIKVHDPNCPLGVNGVRAYWEAREALSSTPPEARATERDREALAEAELELDDKQVCTCGLK